MGKRVAPYSEWRVVKTRFSDGGHYFKLEDVIVKRELYQSPFIGHKPTPLLGHSKSDLRERIEQMLTAFDKPTLTFNVPTLVEEPEQMR